MTPEEVAAVLAKHRADGKGRCVVCEETFDTGAHPLPWPCLSYRLAEQIAAAWDEGEAAGRENEQDLAQSVEFQEPWTNPYRVWAQQP